MNFYKFLLVSVNIGVVFLFFNSIFADNSGVILTVTVADCGNGIVNSGEQCDGSSFGNFNCAGLGFNGGTLSCNTSCQYVTSSCIPASIAYTASTTQIMDFSSGGDFTFDSTNNVLFSFPENFYTEDLKLIANSFSSDSFASEKPAVSGKSFIGQAYDFSFVIPSGSSTNSQVPDLSSPVTITMNYSDSDVSGFNENTLVPYRWGASDSSWQLISGATVDTANNKVSFSTASFSSFTIFGTAAEQSPSPPPSSSGPGGGGAINVPGIASVIFSGRAYPLSAVTLLKDAQIAATTVAGSDSNFQIALNGLSAGSYLFSLYGQDKNGLKSTLFTFPITLTAGATTNVSGIFIAPTISIDKNEVKKGDDITIFGQTASKSDVTIIIGPGEKYSAKIKSNNDGIYLYNFNTSSLDFRDYKVKSMVFLSGSILSFSRIVSFKVGAKNVLAPKPTAKVLKGDINNDDHVNLIDFSIIAYWHNRANPPEKIDLNGDGKVNLIDFSIIAYYWTG